MRIKSNYKPIKIGKGLSLKDHFFGGRFNTWPVNGHTHARKALHNKTGYYYGLPKMKG